MKYRILKDNPYKLEVLEPNGLLQINLKYVPLGVSIEEFVKYIEEQGIILKYE